MLTLTINSHPAILKDGTSIKYTSTNPLFKDTGDFTLEVTLPLKGCPENQRIFGTLHRPETPLTPLIDRRLPFSLLAPPLSVEGTAIVLSADEEEAQLQLLARGAALRLDETLADGRDIYIDDMELGTAFDTTIHYEHTPYFDTTTGQYTTPHRELATALRDYPHKQGSPEETDCVYFPIWSEEDQEEANPSRFHITYDASAPLIPAADYNIPYRPTREGTISRDIAAQPYLCHILERVITALGYTIRHNHIRGTWMERIFIANARLELKYANILPHWTIEEFLTEVQHFFGIVIDVEGKQVDILSRASYYANTENTIHLSSVIDEHTAEMDAEADGNDTTTASIAYDLPDPDDITTLPEEVWENAKILIFDTDEEINQYITENLTQQQIQASAHLFVNRTTAATYAHLLGADGEWQLTRVDLCPPLIRKPGEQYGAYRRDIGITLRIVPCRMTLQYTNVYYHDTTTANEQMAILGTPMLTTSNSRRPILTAYNINNVINSDTPTDTADETTTEKPEVLEVAYNPLTTWDAPVLTPPWDAPADSLQLYLPLAHGIPYTRHTLTTLPQLIEQDGCNDPLRLTNTQPDTIQTTAFTQGFSIDTRLQHTFTFADGGHFPVSSIYIIRGRRYACLQLEYTIDHHGMQPLIRGTFYELN